MSEPNARVSTIAIARSCGVLAALKSCTILASASLPFSGMNQYLGRSKRHPSVLSAGATRTINVRYTLLSKSSGPDPRIVRAESAIAVSWSDNEAMTIFSPLI